MLQRLIEFSLQHRLIVFLSVMITVFLGLSALSNSPAEFLPDLSSPIISVITEKPGLAPQEVENLITRPIENNLQSLPNVVSVRSTSTSGLSLVTVTFKWGTDYYLARQLIGQSLAEVAAKLPAGTAPLAVPSSARMHAWPFTWTPATARAAMVGSVPRKSDASSSGTCRDTTASTVDVLPTRLAGAARATHFPDARRQSSAAAPGPSFARFSAGLHFAKPDIGRYRAQ